MGLFDAIDVDWKEVEEFRGGLPPGTYQAVVASLATEEKESGIYLAITYAVTEGPKMGQTHKETQRIVQGRPQSQAEENSVRAIKTRMMSLGVPEDRINSITPADIEGMEVAITLAPQRNDPRYNNVVRVAVLNSASTLTLPATTTVAGGAQKVSNPDDPFA